MKRARCDGLRFSSFWMSLVLSITASAAMKLPHSRAMLMGLNTSIGRPYEAEASGHRSWVPCVPPVMKSPTRPCCARAMKYGTAVVP